MPQGPQFVLLPFWIEMRRALDIETEMCACEAQIRKAIDDRDWGYAEMLAKRLDELERSLRLSEATRDSGDQ